MRNICEGVSAEMPSSVTASDQHITITCGNNEALMYLGVRSSVKEGGRERRVLFNGLWLTPNEFQTVSGRGAAKDWKRTVKHAGQGIKALLAARLLSIDKEPAGCVCKHCTVATEVTMVTIHHQGWTSSSNRPRLIRQTGPMSSGVTGNSGALAQIKK